LTTLAEVASVPVFDAGGRTYTWADVFMAARLRGEWREPGLPEGTVPDESVKLAGQRFRTERRLLAGDELRAWLTEHRLTLDDWNGYLRRSLLRAGGAAETTPASEDVLWADGTCSGAFHEFAQALARRAAALAAAGGSAQQPDHLLQAERAYEDLVARVAASEAPRRAVVANQADWLRVDCEYLAAPDEDVAREVALLVREDGVPLPDVARQAGLEPAGGLIFAGEMQPDLRTRLMSAGPGDTVGPVPLGGLFAVVAVRGKVEPSMDDPEIRMRAERWAVESALEREVAERVRWRR
jgi:hypothetical protein